MTRRSPGQDSATTWHVTERTLTHPIMAMSALLLALHLTSRIQYRQARPSRDVPIANPSEVSNASTRKPNEGLRSSFQKKILFKVCGFGRKSVGQKLTSNRSSAGEK